MNKTLLSAALIAGFGIAAFAPQAARAVDGTVTINGKIEANTCAINTPGVGSSFTVTLPTVQNTALASSGQVAGTTPFSFVLTGCTGITAGNISTDFQSPAANVLPDGNLKNTGTATLVEVQVLNNTGAAVLLNAAPGAQNATSVAVTAGAAGATLPYYAQYYATGASTAGTVATTVQYSITYP